jgi:hypothetical protein
MVSGALLQKGQTPQLDQPSFASQSAIHTLFLIASQAKNFIFMGAQTFQTIRLMLVHVSPMNCAL